MSIYFLNITFYVMFKKNWKDIYGEYESVLF